MGERVVCTGAFVQHRAPWACWRCYLRFALLRAPRKHLVCRAVALPTRRYKLNVWDVGGQKTLRSYWRNYYEETDGVIWVVDSADRRRLRDCKEEFGKLLGQEKLAGATLLVLANKQDISGALSMDDIATALELGGESTAKRHWKIEPCSAVTGEGLGASVDWLVRDISSRIFLGD